MGLAFLTTKKIIRDKKKKYKKGQVKEESTMLKYLGIVENYYLGIKDGNQEYQLIGYYTFQEEDTSDVVFELIQNGVKVGEIEYDYKEERTNKSEFSFLLDEIENKDYFNTIVTFRGEWLFNNFAFFKMKNLKKTEPIKVMDNSKIGRNDKCPCGSGKKYKKCCFNLSTE